jgi:fructose-1,6-bisphosphatase
MSSIPGRDDVRIMTLQAHILAEQERHAHAGTLSWILSALSISAKIIADEVRRARLENVLGSVGTENVQGETQQKLDVLANDVLMGALGSREGVAIVASEENEEPIMLREDDGRGISRYCVLFDPLDGSPNLDVCGGGGTIFSILALDGTQARAAQSLLRRGRRQIAAGYVLYGSSTVFVLTLGNGVDMFVLDPGVGAFMRVERGLRTRGPRATDSGGAAHRDPSAHTGHPRRSRSGGPGPRTPLASRAIVLRREGRVGRRELRAQFAESRQPFAARADRGQSRIEHP